MRLSNLITVFAMTILLLIISGCDTNKSLTQREIRISAPETDAAEPAIASDADGNVYVVYIEHGADKTADVYLQKFDGNGNPNGEKLRVNPEKGTAKAWRGDPPTIKISSDKAILIGWTAKASAENPNASNLNLSVSRDGGRTFDAPVKVNDDIAPAAHGMHSLELGKDNRIFMAWLDERNIKSDQQAKNIGGANQNNSQVQFVKIHHHNSNQENKSNQSQAENGTAEMKHEAAEPNSEVFLAASGDGKTFSANKRLSSDVCPCCKTNLLAAPDGKLYVSWRQVVGDNYRHIAINSSNDNGASFSKTTIVSDDQWQINACPVSGAALAVGDRNELKTVWFTAGKAGAPGLYESESNDFGGTFSNRILISANAASGTPISLADANGNLKIIWESNTKLYYSQLQANQNNFTEAKIIGDGSLPSAVIVGEKVFVAFIRSESGKRAIWLTEYNAL